MSTAVPTNNVGGPIVPDATTQTATPGTCDATLFASIENVAENCCSAGSTGSLCAAIASGKVWSSSPFNALIDVIMHYSNCDQELSADARQAAMNAFIEVTGWNTSAQTTYDDSIEKTFHDVVNVTSLYIFLPTFILVVVAVWFMYGFGWMTWPAALFFTVLAFVILYAFSILYRTHAQQIVRKKREDLRTASTVLQSNLESGIVYLPQGLFAVASSISSKDGTGWICNKNAQNCPPCTNVSAKGRRVKMPDPEESEEDDDMEPRTPRTPVARRDRASTIRRTRW